MNRAKFLLMILAIAPLWAQEYISFNPAQLAIRNATARVGKIQYSNSSFAQSYYSNQFSLNFTSTYSGIKLSDGKIDNNALQVNFPSYNWGVMQLSYGLFSVSNLERNVFQFNSWQLAYANSISDRFLLGTRIKWSKYQWYFQNYQTQSVSGAAVDLSAIFVLNSDWSIGLSAKNLFMQPLSGLKNDNVLKKANLSILFEQIGKPFSLEAGPIVSEDAPCGTKIGGFINSELSFSSYLNLTGEYERLFFDHLGFFLSAEYPISNYRISLGYGLRWSDSDLPESKLIHALNFKVVFAEKKSIDRHLLNPKIILSDKKPPQIGIKRISNFVLCSRKNPDEILKLYTKIKDVQSGLKTIYLRVFGIKDEEHALFDSTFNISGQTFSDTLKYNCRDKNGLLLENGTYKMRIDASDFAGNISASEIVPFKVLSPINDQKKPEIAIDFDSSSISLKNSTRFINIETIVSVNDESGFVQWRVQLYKMFPDSVWRAIRTYSGEKNRNKRKFVFKLKQSHRFEISGLYKIKVIASDEVQNYSMLWSKPKSIRKQKSARKEELSDFINNVEDHALTDLESAADENTTSPRLIYTASYIYRNQKIRLSDFTFSNFEDFKPETYVQSLSVLGVYLQDLPDARLELLLPAGKEKMDNFKAKFETFLYRAFAIDKSRIEYGQSGNNEIIFKIRERGSNESD